MRGAPASGAPSRGTLRSTASALAAVGLAKVRHHQNGGLPLSRLKSSSDARAVSRRVCVPSLRFLEFQRFLVSYSASAISELEQLAGTFLRHQSCC
jgi:hypothetical protein